MSYVASLAGVNYYLTQYIEETDSTQRNLNLFLAVKESHDMYTNMVRMEPLLNNFHSESLNPLPTIKLNYKLGELYTKHLTGKDISKEAQDLNEILQGFYNEISDKC